MPNASAPMVDALLLPLPSDLCLLEAPDDDAPEPFIEACLKELQGATAGGRG